MLHIVNKSPFESSSLDSCLRAAQKGAAVLLIEDAILAATRGSTVLNLVRGSMKELRFYVLGPDIDARGMQDRIAEGFERIDYEGFVELVVSHSTVQSWL